jgi:hypothetical protein
MNISQYTGVSSVLKVRGPLIDIYTSHVCFLLLDAVGDEVNDNLV